MIEVPPAAFQTDLDLQSHESYAKGAMQKVKVKGHSVQKLRVETDGQTDKDDCITSSANTVCNNQKLTCIIRHYVQ